MNTCKECYHFIDSRKCRALKYAPCLKRTACTFFQTPEEHAQAEVHWAEKILRLPDEKIKTFNSLYYKGRLEKYAEKIISEANQR